MKRHGKALPGYPARKQAGAAAAGASAVQALGLCRPWFGRRAGRAGDAAAVGKPNFLFFGPNAIILLPPEARHSGELR